MQSPPKPTTTPQELAAWARQARPDPARRVLAALLEEYRLPSSPPLDLAADTASLLARALVRSLSSSNTALAELVLKHPVLLSPMACNSLVGPPLLPRLSLKALQVLEDFPVRGRQAFRHSLWPGGAIEEMVEVIQAAHKQQGRLSSDMTARISELVARELYFDLPPSPSWQPHYTNHLPALVARELLDKLVGRVSFSVQQLWEMLEAVKSQVPASDVRYQEVLFHDTASPTLWAQALQQHECSDKLVGSMTQRQEFLADPTCRALAVGQANWVGHWRLLSAAESSEELNGHIESLARSHPRHLLYVFEQIWSDVCGQVDSSSLRPLLSHADTSVRQQAFRYIRRVEGGA